MGSARQTALAALAAFRRQGSWPDLYLKKACAPLRQEEAALASAITYGVLQNRAWLDFLIGQFSIRPVEKLTPQVLDGLRIGAYQLIFLDRIPPRAAVNETVELVKQAAGPGPAGYANGVLRALVRRLDDLPPVPQDSLLDYLSIRYSHPKWFVGKMVKRLGASGCEELLQADNAPAPATARVNVKKISREALLDRLAGEGIAARPHPDLQNGLIFDTMKGVLHSGALEEGLFYLQDTASQLCVEALAPQPGETVLDLCAAPGGKSLAAGQQMDDRGRLISMDLYPHKVALIKENAARSGLSCLESHVADASVFQPQLEGIADGIICDVPCSGMGVIRKKPDVRYKDGDAVKALPLLQRRILENAFHYLKPGGRLVYSTCTLLREENEKVVEDLLEHQKGAVLEAFSLPGIGPVKAGWITLWPHIHGTDGFFMAKLRKASN